MARLSSPMTFRWSSGLSWPWRRLAFHNLYSTSIVRFYCCRSPVQILVFADHVQDEHGEVDFGSLQQGWVYTETICKGTSWISIHYESTYHAFEMSNLDTYRLTFNDRWCWTSLPSLKLPVEWQLEGVHCQSLQLPQCRVVRMYTCILTASVWMSLQSSVLKENGHRTSRFVPTLLQWLLGGMNLRKKP